MDSVHNLWITESSIPMDVTLMAFMFLLIISDTLPFTTFSLQNIGKQVHGKISQIISRIERESKLKGEGLVILNLDLGITRLVALRVFLLWFCAQCSWLYIPGIYLLFCFIDCTLCDIIGHKSGGKSHRESLIVPFAEQFDANKLLRFLPFFAILLWPNLVGFGALSPLQVIWSFVVLRAFWTEWSSGLSPSSPIHSKMNHLKLSFLEYCWAFCSLGGSATLGWLVGVIRKHIMRMRGIEVEDDDMEYALHKMLTESMLVIGITDGDNEQFTSTFQVMVWPQRVKKELQINCRWDEPVVLSVTADGEVISMEDAIVMLSIHRVYSIHTKIHAMANWAFLGEEEFPGRSESVLYNYFGTVTFKKLCGFWSYFSGFDHREYFELLVQDSMKEHFKHPLLFLSFEHKSRIIHFLAEAREAVIEIFRPLGMSHRQTEGVYGVTILHSLDHYTMGTTLDPMILVDSTTTLPEMCDFVTFTECGFVHETPLLLGSYRLSTLKAECFQSLSQRLIEIDDEFGNQIDFAIVQ